jgi:hypothetical protein
LTLAARENASHQDFVEKVAGEVRLIESALDGDRS